MRLMLGDQMLKTVLALESFRLNGKFIKDLLFTK